MTTITKYVCDLCGKSFDDEDECQQHEILEKFKDHSADVVFFDEYKNVITAEQVVSQLYDPWAIFIEDEEVIPLVEEIYDFCGFFPHGVSTAVIFEKRQDFTSMMKTMIVGIFPPIKSKN